MKLPKVLGLPLLKVQAARTEEIGMTQTSINLERLQGVEPAQAEPGRRDDERSRTS